MTHSHSHGSRSRSEQQHPCELPPCRTLLERTDWASLATACGTGESLPVALALLTSPDPLVRESALRDALEPVTHQNSIYEATVPVALYVSAVLGHPDITAGDFDGEPGAPANRPTLVRLLDWLGDTAYDADDACFALAEHPCGEGCRDDGCLDEDTEMRAFRDARPAFFSAVRPLLAHHVADVRHAALVAAVPLVEHPLLTPHQTDLAGHAGRLLATSTDRRHRDRALDALKAWGHDTSELEDASDIAARERYALLRAARASSEGDWAGGGYSADPPF
ncbi:hypothetical protein DEJ51_31405 [Streptomyces venezuelae]|uniref:HEAT repeat domain-containing protein n=1 Tax=Streptomyces venezuelae TaxID=54571 RepID=A0A5P2DVE4_STRVZ|nr:hypothetical protein [Streptomyces venezuelae]QES58098.1 hypothetical protein DEJ51_31405 [Streptomyces venezuelae]